ncbi:PP2C family protein-serine/threonine phosphatase [Streptomyces sp. PAM3C]|uniref:PP2C family protein-serine/threonine phosphatase n=1 Tax=Streptomyces sp. PAM3C TaxID=2847300 RepID=UPI001C1DD368|nr:PP2C family protein-serine/threonine phosphatase [Streptomyces sp. PAM3C]MBU5943569.1 SpoIIE family protein phosphatase [Streptomyces sp. PAM3C]
MPSPLSADRPAARPPGGGPVDALISQTRRLKGEVDAVRRDTPADAGDPRERWRRALYDLAMHQLDDLDEHLAQLRDDPPPAPSEELPAPPAPPRAALLSRVGSAEWDLLTDEVSWSGELYRILGRDPAAPPLTLDELPSLVCDEDRPRLTGMVTGCLIDGRPIDGEFRVLHAADDVRTVHMMGEPVLGADGSTVSMWAVLRDVSELRRCRRTVSETRDSLHRHRHAAARSEHRLAVELQEAVLPAWHGSLRFPRRGPRALDVAAAHLPPSAHASIGGDWYDALELSDDATLLGVGELTGHGVGAASGVAMLLGAVRGMALAGTAPGPLLDCLDRLLDTTAQPVLAGAVCLRYRHDTRTAVWARAGHPAPLLYRGRAGRALDAPRGALLGAAPGSAHEQAEETLEVGDLLLLHTDGLVPGHTGTAAVHRLLALAPRFAGRRSARDCVREVVEEFGEGERRAEHACVLVARVAS